MHDWRVAPGALRTLARVGTGVGSVSGNVPALHNDQSMLTALVPRCLTPPPPPRFPGTTYPTPTRMPRPRKDQFGVASTLKGKWWAPRGHPRPRVREVL